MQIVEKCRQSKKIQRQWKKVENIQIEKNIYRDSVKNKNTGGKKLYSGKNEILEKKY